MLYQNLKNVGQFKSQSFNTTTSRVQSRQYLNHQKSIMYSTISILHCNYQLIFLNKYYITCGISIISILYSVGIIKEIKHNHHTVYNNGCNEVNTSSTSSIYLILSKDFLKHSKQHLRFIIDFYSLQNKIQLFLNL